MRRRRLQLASLLVVVLASSGCHLFSHIFDPSTKGSQGRVWFSLLSPLPNSTSARLVAGDWFRIGLTDVDDHPLDLSRYRLRSSDPQVFTLSDDPCVCYVDDRPIATSAPGADCPRGHLDCRDTPILQARGFGDARLLVTEGIDGPPFDDTAICVRVATLLLLLDSSGNDLPSSVQLTRQRTDAGVVRSFEFTVHLFEHDPTGTPLFPASITTTCDDPKVAFPFSLLPYDVSLILNGPGRTTCHVRAGALTRDLTVNVE